MAHCMWPIGVLTLKRGRAYFDLDEVHSPGALASGTGALASGTGALASGSLASGTPACGSVATSPGALASGTRDLASGTPASGTPASGTPASGTVAQRKSGTVDDKPISRKRKRWAIDVSGKWDIDYCVGPLM